MTTGGLSRDKKPIIRVNHSLRQYCRSVTISQISFQSYDEEHNKTGPELVLLLRKNTKFIQNVTTSRITCKICGKGKNLKSQILIYFTKIICVQLLVLCNEYSRIQNLHKNVVCFDDVLFICTCRSKF